MRVICMKSDAVLEEGCTSIRRGNIYTSVEQEYVDGFSSSGIKCLKGIYYKLLETGNWYHHSLFIVINEDQQDETEMIREYDKSITSK